MKPDTKRLGLFWQERQQEVVDKMVKEAGEQVAAYGALPSYLRHDLIANYINHWIQSLIDGEPSPIMDGAVDAVPVLISEGITILDFLAASDILRKEVWSLMGQLYSAGDWDMDVVELVERWFHENRRIATMGFNERSMITAEQLAERERAIEAQSRLIQELSVPIVPMHEGVLVLPLVGAVDSRRASQIMESALEQIVVYQADVLILDITGVPVVDTGVANYILQMARAVTLLGSRVVLVGIGAEIAQTIVQLGVELHNITTLANLQAGIAYALALQGYAITANSNALALYEMNK
jgi:rsbT co-antagonist protein RsbR